MGGMTKAVEVGWAKLQIEAMRGREAGAHRPRQGRDRRRQQVPARRARTPIEIREIDNTAVRDAQIDAAGATCAPGATRARSHAALAALTEAAAHGGTATCSTSRSRPMRARATVGEISDALEKVWGRHRARTAEASPASTVPRSRATTRGRTLQGEIERFAARGGPPAAHHGRQARPGRPRPRRQGGRHRVRRSRLRRRHRPAVPDAGGSRAPGDRERRPRDRRVHARGRPQDAGAADHRGAAGAGRCRHRGLRRRRDPAAGLRFL